MTTTHDVAFGARLRKLRLERSLSQRQVAEPQYTAAYISTVEAGKRRPSRTALEHFATRLDIDVEELATGKPRGLDTRLVLRLNDARVHASAGRIDDAEKIIASVRRQAKRYELERIEARADEVQAHCLELRGEFEDALEIYRAICDRFADSPAIFRTTATVGVARLTDLRGDPHYAIHVLERFLSELAVGGTPDPQSLIMAHAALVAPYLKVGLRNRASQHGEEALKLLPVCEDGYALATMHLHVARVLLADGNVGDASAALTRAEDLFQELDLRTELASARFAHGYALAHDGDQRRAEDLLKSALRTYGEVDRGLDAGRATNELARLYRLQGRGAEARELLQKALVLLEDADPAELGVTHRELALCEDDASTAQSLLERALELFALGDDRPQLAATHGLLGDLKSAAGDASGACRSYRQGITRFMEDGDGFLAKN